MESEPSRCSSLKSIWKSYLQSVKKAPTARRFYEMCASGSKYARLAAGGECSV